ncbi:hypothetical protein PJWF_00086 [Achromobacter phage JWF]|uniref:hypothetical protein n=1 Tax=Achromobacter phage JWF TaxID=1589748 RepID=UPI000588E1A3|nr:hypothetical protein AXJ13_gp102 [Achromobacter phage JWF]AJD82979.1 hypothetical protein PJWF_00086 [Achromobacter phage JWF]
MRTHFGVDIEPHGPNTMGMRWLACIGESKLRSDTLDGMKRMIQEELATQTLGCYLQYGKGEGPFLTKKAPAIYQESLCETKGGVTPTHWKLLVNGRWLRLYANNKGRPRNFVNTPEGRVEVTIDVRK